MNKDLSSTAGNPAHDLTQEYERLMQIEDPSTLRSEAIKVVRDKLGHGMSKKNYNKFINTINRKTGLTEMQFYITNFILGGAGLKVVNDDIEVIAGLISESIGEVRELTKEQKIIKETIERHGYKISIL